MIHHEIHKPHHYQPDRQKKTKEPVASNPLYTQTGHRVVPIDKSFFYTKKARSLYIICTAVEENVACISTITLLLLAQSVPPSCPPSYYININSVPSSLQVIFRSDASTKQEVDWTKA